MSALRSTRKKRIYALLALAAVLFIAIIALRVYRLQHHAYVLVTPGKYSECAGQDISVHIKWDLRGTASGQTVYASAYKVGMLPVGFASGPLIGEVDTGPWVNDGTTLLLSDDEHHVLVKRTIESTDCATSPIWAESP